MSVCRVEEADTGALYPLVIRVMATVIGCRDQLGFTVSSFRFHVELYMTVSIRFIVILKYVRLQSYV